MAPAETNPQPAAPVSAHRGERRHPLVATAAAHGTQGRAPAVVAVAENASSAGAPQPASPALVQHADAQPTPSPQPTQLAEVPNGGWGQNFANPLLADESALDDLRAKYHGTASVQVDEAGHAVKVVLAGSLTPEARDEIEKRLLSLHYVPAECNGLRCTGTLQLAL